MLSADHARKAVQLLLGNSVQVGNPVPFSHAYDNQGGAPIDIFNTLMQGGGSFAFTGVFGIPDTGEVGNMTSNFPRRNSTWSGTSFILTADPNIARWTGSASSLNDVVIDIDGTTGIFTGTIGIYGDIIGRAEVNMVTGEVRVKEGTLSISTLFTNIFYGKISWGMTNDGSGETSNQLMVASFTNLIGTVYSVTVNAAKLLGVGATMDSLQGEVTGTANQVIFAGMSNIYFDGYIFPVTTN